MTPLRQGSPIAQGQFVLDRQRALEKLREFQLPSPYFYVLEFVKAAHILGATRIDFSISINRVQVDFDGESLTTKELQSIYEVAFSHRASVRQDALRHLAIGVSAAQGLGLRDLTIEIGDPTPHGVSLIGDEITPLDEFSGHGTGTRISLLRRVGPAHLGRFVSRIRGELPEVETLAEKCRFSQVPIYVDDTLISKGFALDTETRSSVNYSHRGESGVVALRTDDLRFSTHVLQHGVLIGIDHRETPFADFGCQAYVDSPHLTANLSQSAFVEDGAWDALHQRLQRVSFMALADFLNGLSSEEITARRKGLRKLIISLMGPLSASDQRELFEGLSVFENLPIFEEAGRQFRVPNYVSIADARRLEDDGAGGRRSVLQISQCDATRSSDLPPGPVLRIRSSERRTDHASVSVKPGDNEFPAISGHQSRPAANVEVGVNVYPLHELFRGATDRIEDYTSQFERGATWQENRRKWTQRDPWASHTGVFDNLQTQTGSWEITVSPGLPSAPTQVRYIKEGRLLGSQSPTKDHLPSPVIVEISSDHMEPNDLFNGPRLSEDLRAAQLQALQLLARKNFFSPDNDQLLMRLAWGQIVRQFQRLFEWPEMPEEFPDTPLGRLIQKAKARYARSDNNDRGSVDRSKSVPFDVHQRRQELEGRRSKRQQKRREKTQPEVRRFVALLTEHTSLEPTLQEGEVLLEEDHPALAAYLQSPDDPVSEAFAVVAGFLSTSSDRSELEPKEKFNLFEKLTASL